MKHLKLDDLMDRGHNGMNFKSFTFNGGEEHIAIEDNVSEEVLIEASLVNSRKVMQLLIATDALRRSGCKKINLFAPYIPYARQDRVCNSGESLSIKVMAGLINSQGYNRVFTLDNHSDVTSALIHKNHEINIANIIMRMTSENSVEKGTDFTRYALVSPDAGALKKTYKLSKALGGVPVIECGKKRNVSTGEITATMVYEEKDVVKSFDRLLIVDDICDGGKTFIELAKALKAKKAKSVELYVSHGIFSKGMSVFEGLIDKIYTTRSFVNQVTTAIGEKFLLSDIDFK